MIWDPIFGWDWDRIRMIFLVSLFAFLFSGFISTTEGGGFFDPSQQLLTWVGEHEVAFLMVAVVLLAGIYSWWKSEVGW